MTAVAFERKWSHAMDLASTGSAAQSVAVLHSLVWALVALLTMYCSAAHTRSRKRGYLEFYRRCAFLRKAAFYVVSAGTKTLPTLAKEERKKTGKIVFESTPRRKYKFGKE